MQSISLKLAQRASQDTSLIASLIDRYGEREKLRWEEISSQLWIDEQKLAVLALCRRPRPAQFSEDIAQISNYVGISHKELSQFIRNAEVSTIHPVSRKPAKVQPAKPKRGRFLGWSFAVATLIILIISAFVFLQPGTASGTMVVLDGDASIIKGENLISTITNQNRRQYSGGEIVTLQAGDTILVGPSGYARLQLQDGSTIEVFENTVIEIENLDIGADSYQVRFRMLSGKTINRVRRLLELGDFYQVTTPSSTVSVRGTVFTVQIISPETTYISCEEGVVQVSIGDQVLDLKAGEEIYAVAGKNPVPQQQPQLQQPTQSPTTQVQPAEISPTNTPNPKPTIILTPTLISPTPNLTPLPELLNQPTPTPTPVEDKTSPIDNEDDDDDQGDNDDQGEDDDDQGGNGGDDDQGEDDDDQGENNN